MEMSQILMKVILIFLIYIPSMRNTEIHAENIIQLLSENDLLESKQFQELLIDKQINQTAISSLPIQVTSTQATLTTTPKPRACHCGGGLCSCCSRLLFNNWNQKACVNVTYDPDEFSFTTRVLLNDRILYTRTVSGKNPRPVCVPVPRIPAVRACVRFYNIYFQGRNVHVCINMEGKFSDTTVFKVGLDCIRLGANGVAVVKPEDGGGLGQLEILPGSEEDENDNYDDEDEDEDDEDDDDDDSDDDDDDDDY